MTTEGAQIEVALSGSGPAVLLVHGIPHTRALWSVVVPQLQAASRVIAVDLRGCGGSSRAADGYDAQTLSQDLLAVLDAVHEPTADVVAIDAGVPPAFVLGLTRPDRVKRLVLMESALGGLPGAEEFFRNGPPWWFAPQQPNLDDRTRRCCPSYRHPHN